MDATTTMTRLCDAIDAHSGDVVAGLLHEDFRCRYVHTGEVFDRDSWVRLNAEYPGFDHRVLKDSVGIAARAAGRSHVTGYVDHKLQHFEVATFISLREGLVVEMTEVWADVNSVAPPDARPS